MEALLGLMIIILFFVLKKNLNLKKQLKSVSKIADAVTDGDNYLQSKKAEADQIVNDANQTADQLLDDANQKLSELSKQTENLTQQKIALQQELSSLELDIVVGSVRIDAYDGLESEDMKNQLTLLRSREDDCVKQGQAVQITKPEQAKKFLNNQTKQILRCFNAEVSSLLSSVTPKNVDSIRAKITRAYETANKIFTDDGVQISYDYMAMKLEELSMIYAQLLKEEEEREQRKAIREQMVEEEKVRREIEREKAKIEKEQNQFSNEVKKLMGYMQKSSDDVERKLYLDKIAELEERLKGLEKDKENVLQREQNTRAGFVYIISNIGSFGEGVYKIGMTRRLDPMERIAELSSASVPFVFDVHALIFSDDAPALETCLHQTFRDYQVNKVNPRKEFFRVDLDDIKRIVKENHNATVQFIDIPDAEEYRESLRIAAQA